MSRRQDRRTLTSQRTHQHGASHEHHGPTQPTQHPDTHMSNEIRPPDSRNASHTTLLEGSGIVTRREGDVADNTITVREIGTHPLLGAGPAGTVQLPDELANEYHVLRQLEQTGGEATLFEVLDTATDEIRVLKLYYRHVRLRQDALCRIQTIDAAHVVRLTAYGQLADGRWYEVQERIAGGNLIDYRSSQQFSADDIVQVVDQLASAISAFHGADLAHHDIKPENILVRSSSPLDLVLGDFGQSVVANHSTYYATSRNATIAYQAPETVRLVGGLARDYWALGLTIAMLATGTSPYEGLNEYGILDQHHKQVPPPIVESMPEGRLKQLCRGLTRYDPKARWCEGEVRSWLEGDSPHVPPESPPGRPDSRRAVRFNNNTFISPAELAREMVACWSLAAEIVGITSRRQPFMDELILAFGTETLARLTERWGTEPPSRSRLDAAIVELVMALDDATPATYRGRALSADSVAAAGLGDSDSDTQFVKALRTRAVLEAWSRCGSNAELGAIDRRWRQELREAEEIISQAEAAGARAPAIDAWSGPLLAVCARNKLLEDWKRQQRGCRLRGEGEPDWYRRIANESTPAAIVGAVLLAHEAERIQQLEFEARRREREQAKRQRRALQFRILRAVTGWLTAVAFLGGAALVLPRVELYGRLIQWEGRVALLALAFALFRQWSNSGSDRHRAEAYGIAAAAAAAYWAHSNGLSPWPVHLLRGDWSDPLWASADAYKLAGLLSVAWSLLSYLHRRSEGPPTTDEVQGLREADRRTLKRTFWFTVTGVVPGSVGALLVVTSLGDDLGIVEFGQLFLVAGLEMAVAVVMRGLWFPLAAGGLSMLVRGRWFRRPAGAAWALALLVASAMALAAGQSKINSLTQTAYALWG